MRILILSWRCLKNPDSGGSELYFHELSKRWAKNGHEIVWFSPQFSGGLREEYCDGIKIIRKGNRFSVYLHSFLKYVKNDFGNFDVIIDVENGIPFFSPLYIKKGEIFLHIQHIHKNVWVKEMPIHLAIIGKFLESVIMPLIYKKNKIITISNSSFEEIKNDKLSNNDVYIVNPGIEFYKFKKYKKNKKATVLFLNRIKKYKGIMHLLMAAKELKNQNIDFWIVGSGEYLDKAVDYAKREKLNNVIFFGKVDEERKKEIMQKSWILVNPSYKEGWGIVNIEANYFGIPVIGSNVSGIKDSVIDRRTGLLFEYGNHKELANKINFLVDNYKERKYMGKEAKIWAKKFDWDSKAMEYLKILEKFKN